MSPVQEIESAVSQLSAAELAAFRAWFVDFDAQLWDRQLEEDVAAGRLDAVAEDALRRSSRQHTFMSRSARILDTATLPNDADGDALRRLIANGSDLSREMEIEFQVLAPDEASAMAFASAVQALGFLTSVYSHSDGPSWTCECARTMVPSYAAIIEVQRQLEQIGRPFRARPDGWGSFGNAEG